MLPERRSTTTQASCTPVSSADLFLNITSNYKFVGFDILPDFGVWNIFKNPQVPQAIEGYKQHLDRYCGGNRWGRHCPSRRVAC